MKYSIRHHIAVLITMLTIQYAHAQQAPLPYGEAISVENASVMASAAEAEARKNGWFMAITVVDPAGQLVYFRRMDNTQTGSINVSIGKARSAAMFRRPTKLYQELLAQGPANVYLLGIEGVVVVQGGIPLIVDKKVVGAIGVSGGTGDMDSQVAEAGVKALAAAINTSRAK